MLLISCSRRWGATGRRNIMNRGTHIVVSLGLGLAVILGAAVEDTLRGVDGPVVRAERDCC